MDVNTHKVILISGIHFSKIITLYFEVDCAADRSVGHRMPPIGTPAACELALVDGAKGHQLCVSPLYTRTLKSVSPILVQFNGL